MAAPVGVVTGLHAELRVLQKAVGDTPYAACAGASSARAAAVAEQLSAAGAKALISFGVAGGLAPALPPGSLILAESLITTSGEELPTDSAWRERLLAESATRNLDLVNGPMLGSDRAVGGRAAKRSQHEETGALAVDMESHAVARVAAAQGLPFIALRAIADPVDRALPRAVQGIVGVDGRPRTAPLVLGLCRRPWELRALLVLNRDFRQALDALAQAATTLWKPLFGGL